MEKQKLVARGRMGSYALVKGRNDQFYAPTLIDEANPSRSVTDNLDSIQSTLLNMNESTDTRLKELEKFVLELQAWPVGSTFISLDDISPAVKLGYGNWVLVSEGKCLVGAGAGKALGQTGGQREIALSEAHMPHHTHNVTVGDLHASVVTDVQGGVRQTDGQGAHSHQIYKQAQGAGGMVTLTQNEYSNFSYNASPGESMTTAGHHAHNVDINHAHNVNISHGHAVGEQGKGGNAAFNIENPYLVVNIWNRVS